MDAEKLKNILQDFEYESEENINDTLTELISQISANNSVEITKNYEVIKEYFEYSISNEYNPSNLKITEIIGANDYFGIKALQKIDSILNMNQFNINKIVKDLNDYVTNRTKFTKLLQETNNNLEELNIESHYNYEYIYEIGLLFPTEYTKNKISIITKELNRWDKVIRTIKELTEGTTEETEINFLNNGSLEFFINNGVEVATFLAITLERITKIYKNVVEIRAAKQKLETLGISQAEQKQIEKQEKELVNSQIEDLGNELVKRFAIKSIEAGRLNELKIFVRGHLVYIAKCIDNGIIVEINPPAVITPPEIDENDSKDIIQEKQKSIKGYNEIIKKIEIIDTSMKAIKEVGKTGLNIIKYLNENNEESSTEDDQ